MQKYHNYKSVFIKSQEILCHAALEELRVHYLKPIETTVCNREHFQFSSIHFKMSRLGSLECVDSESAI